MIFCLPYEVCDCLSKSIASIAFTARFNFLFSDVIKEWFRSESKDFRINEQMYPSSTVHLSPWCWAHFLISRQPAKSPKLGTQAQLFLSLYHRVPSPSKERTQILLWVFFRSLGCITLSVNNGTLTLLWWKWNTPNIYKLALGTGMRKKKKRERTSYLVLRIFRNCKISENWISLRALKNLKPGKKNERETHYFQCVVLMFALWCVIYSRQGWRKMEFL